MLILEETKAALDSLLTDSFLLNMQLDNLVYQIDAANYTNIAPIVHEHIAHKPPVWADMISDFMISMDAKPIRGNLVDEYEGYAGDLVKIFAEMKIDFAKYREKIIDALDIAEFNNDVETKLFLEEFLNIIIPYYKQIRVWISYLERYQDDFKSFDVHFADFTSKAIMD